MPPRPGRPALLTTRRLSLRAPHLADAEVHRELHTDPRLFGHTPRRAVDPARSREDLAAWIEHWAREGFGYAMACDETGAVVGVAGLQRTPERLNLYYRFSPAAQGQGLAREAVRAVLAWAAEHLPGEEVGAVIRVANTASVRTATICGLQTTADIVPGDTHTSTGSSMATWLMPRLHEVGAEQVEHAPRAAMLQMWRDVAHAGGAVGCRADAEVEDIAPTLDRMLDRTRTAEAVLVLQIAANTGLCGFGWWQRGHVGTAHVWRLRHLQVDPAHRHLGLGRVLLAGMHAVARGHGGVELVTVAYPSGTGLGAFFAGSGYAEVGRLPRAVRLGVDDDRDEVFKARRLDGRPLRSEGRD